ncbi:hypothetical protein POTOM_020039 [Populus tomentosa]|uniref:Uncharacterized protein n=1 Tax=Populus tomentosa TaxID=118781 RepID=A0A8X8CUQ5_POPTO|nr:hypothetical protein POTOM_020039 [Populus tomentosa]
MNSSNNMVPIYDISTLYCQFPKFRNKSLQSRQNASKHKPENREHRFRELDRLSMNILISLLCNPQEELHQTTMEESMGTTLVSNGCVDIQGRIADKRTTGGWKAAPFIIVNEVAERLAFYAIAVNMVAYLVFQMHQSLPDAATRVTDWIQDHRYFLLHLYSGNGVIDALSFYRQLTSTTMQDMGALFGITVFVYIQDNKGWAWGFGLPTGAMVISIVILVAGIRLYRFQEPMGSPFTRFVQVMWASVRNHLHGVQVGHQTELYEVNTNESDIKGAQKLSHTIQYSFLDKAAVVTDPEADTRNRWRLCTLSTFFISQANIMDRKLASNFIIPAGSVPIFSVNNVLILVPVYEKVIVPVLRKHTGHSRGITSLQRIGVGLFISIFAVASAALVEKKRRHSPNPDMSVFWLFPQFFLIGSAEVFSYVGQLEFFYDEATDGTRSISSAMFLSEIGIGSWLISTAIVKIIERATGGEEKGWLRNNLTLSKLDYFYWVLTSINAVNLAVYVWIAVLYKGRGGAVGGVRSESVFEMGDGVFAGKRR